MLDKLCAQKSYKLLTRFAPIICFVFASMSAMGEVAAENTIKVRAGTVTLLKDDNASILKLGKKVITKSNEDIVVIDGPFMVGLYDVILLGQKCGGSVCGDSIATELYLIDAKGNVTKAKGKDYLGKDMFSFDCDWDPYGKTNPILKDGKLIFQCTSYDGRRSTTSYLTYEKNVMTWSRQSKLWPTKK
ncbi:MAG: hypothetical protein PHO76_07810 [Methylotenera sp.]|nr:hypothetical protein [Methylotenera sp.]MDD4924912.1 hypothetical protein [Methylotenera sp.]